MINLVLTQVCANVSVLQWRSGLKQEDCVKQICCYSLRIWTVIRNGIQFILSQRFFTNDFMWTKPNKRLQRCNLSRCWIGTRSGESFCCQTVYAALAGFSVHHSNVFVSTERRGVRVLWTSSCPSVLCVKKSWRIQSLTAVDTGSAESASPHTGTSLLRQESSPVPSVEKDLEPDLDCRQPARPALHKVRLLVVENISDVALQKGEGFVSYTAVSHQRAMQMSIFILQSVMKSNTFCCSST